MQKDNRPRGASCRVDHGEVDKADAVGAPLGLAGDGNRSAVDEPAEGRHADTEADGQRAAGAPAEAEVDASAVGREDDLGSAAGVGGAAGAEGVQGAGSSADALRVAVDEL